jgi:hypothetical protein
MVSSRPFLSPLETAESMSSLYLSILVVASATDPICTRYPTMKRKTSQPLCNPPPMLTLSSADARAAMFLRWRAAQLNYRFRTIVNSTMLDGFPQLQRVGTHSRSSVQAGAMARMSFGGDGKYFEESVNVSSPAAACRLARCEPAVCAERSNQDSPGPVHVFDCGDPREDPRDEASRCRE